MPQTAFIGPGSLARVQDVIRSHHAQKVLLVTGKNSYTESDIERLLAPYLKSCDVVRFFDFTPNPKLEEAQAGIDLIRVEQPDMVIAIGGGSVIDMAKIIVSMAAQAAVEAKEMVLDQTLLKTKGLPFVAIPTTAGTGSEATHFAVVYIDRVKYSLAHQHILPDYAIVDSRLAHSSPSGLVASCGMDALTQAVESYWAVGSTTESRNYASQAIKMILPVVNDLLSDDLKIKEIMAEAAYNAGKAINISKTTAAHAISYPITTFFGVPHGHAVALMLGKFFVVHSAANEESIIDIRGKQYLDQILSDLLVMFDCGTPRECCRKWYQMMDQLGLQTDLRVIGIQADTDLKLIESHISLERLNNNPVSITSEMLRDMLTRSWVEFC